MLSSLYRKLWKEPRDAKGPVRTTALWLLAAWACSLVVYSVRTGRRVLSILSTVLPEILFALFVVCLLVGSVIRIVQWGHTIVRSQPGRQSGFARVWSDEVPRRRRRIRNDDPELPLGRRR
jgi:hypothetical protein